MNRLSEWRISGLRVLPLMVLLPVAVADAELLAYWDFYSPSTIATVDAVEGFPCMLRGGARISADQLGRSGSAGDTAAQLGTGNQRIEIEHVLRLDEAALNGTLTITFWLRQNSVRNSTILWLHSWIAEGSALSVHLPWSNGMIYFDSAGCCGSPMRLEGAQPDGINWNDWHHVAIIRNGDSKEIWIDGGLVLNGSGYDPLPGGFTILTIGNAANHKEAVDGDLDDLAFFDHAMTQRDIQALASGQSPATFATAPIDSDGDGLPDRWEARHFADDLTNFSGSGDFDSDGLSDLAEYLAATNPTVVDSDGDLLSDGVETGTGVWVSATDTGTHPLIPDTDGDGLMDGQETMTGTYLDRSNAGTDPYNSDTDGDGVGDLVEVHYWSNPVNPDSVPMVPGVPLLLAYWSFNRTNYPEAAVDEVKGIPADVVNATYTAGNAGRSGAPGDEAIGFTGSGQWVEHRDFEWVKVGTREDQLTVTFWQKLNSVVPGSSFWFLSPSSGEGQRGFQAHVPWHEDNNIYFDTGGCCNPPNRLNGLPDPEPDYFVWTHFAFVKNGLVKEVWVNGELLLAGVDAAPLPHDFHTLRIGSDGGLGNIDGMIDDFAIYAGALSATEIRKLADGDLPTEVGGSDDADGDGMPDTWEYLYFPNDRTILSDTGDFDHDGLPDALEFIRKTAPNNGDTDGDGLRDVVETGTGVWASADDCGTDPRNPDTDGDRFPDGVEDNSGVYLSQASPGTSPLMADSDGDGFPDWVEGTVEHLRSSPVDAASVPFAADKPYLLAYWTFNQFTDAFLAADTTRGVSGILENGPEYTQSGGGRSGQVGDHAVSIPSSGRVYVEDAGFLNLAVENITVSYWQRLNAIQDSSAFWMDSPSSSGRSSGLQVNSVWGNGGVYFDHSGCCDALTRLEGPLPDATDLLNAWHHFVVIRSIEAKQVWLDGELLLAGGSGAPLPGDLTSLSIGSDHFNDAPMNGDIDEFAVFAGALSPDRIARLAAGESADTILGDAPSVVDFRVTKITRGNDGSISLTWNSDVASGTSFSVESATSLSGWTLVMSDIDDQAGTTTVNLPGPFPQGRIFFRVRK